MGKPFKDRTGETNYNNFGSKMIIKKYRNSMNIDIYFPDYDCTIYHKTYKDFKNGKIGCPYEPRAYGIGYIGIGNYKVHDEFGKNTKAYATWHDMLRRCYNNAWKAKYPTYKDCFVNEEWLNYQNFAKWFDDNYYTVEDELMCIDKDILCKGNKEYGPDTCVFTPQKINSLFVKSDNIRGDLPIGVCLDKYKRKYEAKCQDGNNNKIHLGVYDTIEDAFDAYKEEKEFIFKLFAEAYKNDIPDDLYIALYNYEVEIDD